MSQTNGHDLRGPILILAAAGLLHAAAIANDDFSAVRTLGTLGLVVGATGYLYLLVPLVARLRMQNGEQKRTRG